AGLISHATPQFDEDLVKLWYDKKLIEAANNLRKSLSSVILNSWESEESSNYRATDRQLAQIVDNALEVSIAAIGLTVALGFDVEAHWKEKTNADWEKIKERTMQDHGKKVEGGKPNHISIIEKRRS